MIGLLVFTVYTIDISSLFFLQLCLYWFIPAQLCLTSLTFVCLCLFMLHLFMQHASLVFFSTVYCTCKRGSIHGKKALNTYIYLHFESQGGADCAAAWADTHTHACTRILYTHKPLSHQVCWKIEQWWMAQVSLYIRVDWQVCCAINYNAVMQCLS